MFQTFFDNRCPAVATVFDQRMAIFGEAFRIACRDIPLSTLTTLLVVRCDKQGHGGLLVWIAIPSRTGDGRISGTDSQLATRASARSPRERWGNPAIGNFVTNSILDYPRLPALWTTSTRSDWRI